MIIEYQFDDATRRLDVTDPTPANQDRPLVLLLHGTGGTIDDMTAPAVQPGQNYDHDGPLPPDQDHGWHVWPGVGVRGVELDRFKDVRSWRDVLEEHDFRTVAYSQVAASGLLADPVRELAAVVDALVREIPGVRLVLLAQSRGGLLVRRFLADHQDDPARVEPVRMVITLHSPHQGSALASVAVSIRTAIDDLEAALGSVVETALGWLRDMVDTDAFQEMTVGGSFLATLAREERALPWVEYHTFGGTGVRLTRILGRVFSAGSAVPRWHWPPFRHRTAAVPVPGVSPILDSLPDLVPEITPGQGDILTADSRTRHPFAAHRTNRLSHAESLWDEELQAQVLALLGEDVTFW